MYFQLLGPLQVWGETGAVEVLGTRRRALLSILVLHAGDGVQTAQLIEDLWETKPPGAAVATMQSHISAIRRLIGPERLHLRGGAYVLEADCDEIDARVFEAEVSTARLELDCGNAHAAARLLDQGLRRWHGPALADALGAHWAVPEVARLDEIRGVAIESMLEACLHIGDYHQVTTRAEAALALHPWRERIWGQLMIALYRSGRQAEALRAYQRLRHELSNQLGISPSPELARLEKAILLQKPELDLMGAFDYERPLHSAMMGSPRASGGGNLTAAVPTEWSTDMWARWAESGSGAAAIRSTLNNERH
jgi:DNA-binding SARP family transcriptional activator